MDGMHLATSDLGSRSPPLAQAEIPWKPGRLFNDPCSTQFFTKNRPRPALEGTFNALQARLAQWKAHDFMKAAGPALVVGVVQSPEAVMHCPHLAERGTFVALDHPEAGRLLHLARGF